MAKFEGGSLYYIKFLDHAVGIKVPITCHVVGWVLKDEDNHIALTYWKVDSEDEEVVNNNIEPFVILKSAILRKLKLRLS